MQSLNYRRQAEWIGATTAVMTVRIAASRKGPSARTNETASKMAGTVKPFQPMPEQSGNLLQTR